VLCDLRQDLLVADRPALEEEITSLLLDENRWTVVSRSIRVDRDYRRRLEAAIGFASTQDSAVPVRAGLQARLLDVLAEQQDRAGIARA